MVRCPGRIAARRRDLIEREHRDAIADRRPDAASTLGHLPTDHEG
jgi:hypothetical protein